MDRGPDDGRHADDRQPGDEAGCDSPPSPRRAKLVAHLVEAVEPAGTKRTHDLVGLLLI